MVVYTLPVQVSGRGSILDEGEDESDLITAPLQVSQDYLFFRHWSICHKLEITNKMRDELPVSEPGGCGGAPRMEEALGWGGAGSF